MRDRRGGGGRGKVGKRAGGHKGIKGLEKENGQEREGKETKGGRIEVRNKERKWKRKVGKEGRKEAG